MRLRTGTARILIKGPEGSDSTFTEWLPTMSPPLSSTRAPRGTLTVVELRIAMTCSFASTPGLAVASMRPELKMDNAFSSPHVAGSVAAPLPRIWMYMQQTYRDSSRMAAAVPLVARSQPPLAPVWTSSAPTTNSIARQPRMMAASTPRDRPPCFDRGSETSPEIRPTDRELEPGYGDIPTMLPRRRFRHPSRRFCRVPIVCGPAGASRSGNGTSPEH